MSYYLFLDDERVPRDVTWVKLPLVPWVIARNYDSFTQYIQKNGLPEFVTFDHDLAHNHYPTTIQTGKEIIDYDKFTEKTGYHCAQWLVNYCQDNKVKLPSFSVHSMNVVGKVNIIQLLSNFVKFQTENPS